MSNLVKAGRTNFLYYNNRANVVPFTGVGTYFAPAWVVINRIGDLDRPMSKVSSDIDMRASPTTITVYGNRQKELSFTYYKKQGANDLVFNALLYSYETNQELDMAIAEDNIATAGTVYDRGPFVVAEMNKSEPIAGVDAFDIKLKVVLYDFTYMPFRIVGGATLWDDAVIWADDATWLDVS